MEEYRSSECSGQTVLHCMCYGLPRPQTTCSRSHIEQEIGKTIKCTSVGRFQPNKIWCCIGQNDIGPRAGRLDEHKV